MKITPPAGYEQIAPLQKHHRVTLPANGATPPAFGRLHAIPISLAEFGPASRDYPLVFLSDEDGNDFTAVAALGLQPGQNLFVLGDGLWDRRVYLPAYVRRFPFCMSKVAVDGKESMERVICVEASALRGGGEALYDRNGEPLGHWTVLERLIFDYESELARSEELCKLLGEMDLLEPFAMKAEVDGFTMQLEGMHRVNQERLESLHEDSLRRLFEAGMMDKIYAHLLSLENFRRLLNRRSFFAIKPPSDSRELN
jgi:hypothetical protein